MSDVVCYFSTPENDLTLSKADFEDLYTCVRDAMLAVQAEMRNTQHHSPRTLPLLQTEYARLERLAEKTYRLSGGLGDHL